MSYTLSFLHGSSNYIYIRKWLKEPANIVSDGLTDHAISPASCMEHQ
jgi:hypothetical protein